MTKLEAWKAWHESLGIGMEATEHALEKGSHGKAFSYAWDAAVKAEREAIGDIILDYAERDDLSDSDESLLKHLFDLIRARNTKE